VEGTVAYINRLLSAHRGSVQVYESEDPGVLRVQFGGMCTGCPLRPLTLAATIRPLLLQVPGVTDVAMTGGRISHEAEARIDRYLGAQSHLPTI
jgi:Fe-S cluster biogenesis protein NfuA